jgi:uncharacterized protein (DUF4415 family)
MAAKRLHLSLMDLNGMKAKRKRISQNTASVSTTRSKSLKTATSPDRNLSAMKIDTKSSGFHEEQASMSYAPRELTASELSLRAKLLKPNKDGIVRISYKDWRRLPRYDTDWSKFDAITDEDIAKAVADDPDAAPLDMDWSKAKIVTFKPKIAMSIRVDPDVYDFFKATGKNYQTRMNAVLKAFVEHDKNRKS